MSRIRTLPARGHSTARRAVRQAPRAVRRIAPDRPTRAGGRGPPDGYRGHPTGTPGCPAVTAPGCPLVTSEVVIIQRTIAAAGLLKPPTYSHASIVEAGTRLAFLAGSVPLDADGQLIGPGDPVRQTEQVLANLEGQLHAIGSDLSQVVYTDVYVVSSDPAVLAEVWRVVEASGLSTAEGGPHSSTLLGVASLGYPGQLVEITATAVVPE